MTRMFFSAVKVIATGLTPLSFLFLSASFLHARTDPQAEAKKLGTQAIKVMDEGNPDEAIKLLKEAQKLDPTSHMYPYEIAYAHYIKKEYGTAKDILRKTIADLPKVDAQTYALLGNIEDIDGNIVQDAILIR